NPSLRHRPVRVGELVDVECRVRDLRPHRKGRTFEAVSTILGQDGEIIATDVSTYLVRGGGEDGATPSAGKSSAGEPSAAQPSGTSPSAGKRADRRAVEPPRPTARGGPGAGPGRRSRA